MSSLEDTVRAMYGNVKSPLREALGFEDPEASPGVEVKEKSAPPAPAPKPKSSLIESKLKALTGGPSLEEKLRAAAAAAPKVEVTEAYPSYQDTPVKSTKAAPKKNSETKVVINPEIDDTPDPRGLKLTAKGAPLSKVPQIAESERGAEGILRAMRRLAKEKMHGKKPGEEIYKTYHPQKGHHTGTWHVNKKGDGVEYKPKWLQPDESYQPETRKKTLQEIASRVVEDCKGMSRGSRVTRSVFKRKTAR